MATESEAKSASLEKMGEAELVICLRALLSIAYSSCCSCCQEASLVAKKALKEIHHA